MISLEINTAVGAWRVVMNALSERAVGVRIWSSSGDTSVGESEKMIDLAMTMYWQAVAGIEEWAQERRSRPRKDQMACGHSEVAELPYLDFILPPSLAEGV